MLARRSKLFWKKQLMVLLAFIVVVGGFPAAFASVAKAADSAPNLIVDYEFRDPGNGGLPVDKLGHSKLEEVSGEHTFNGKTRMYGNATKGYGADSAGSYWYWTAINEGKDEKGGGFTLDIDPVVDKDISRSYSVGVRFSYDKFNPNWTKIIDYKDKTTTEGFYFTGDGDRKLMFYNVGTKGATTAEPKQIVDIIATRNNDSKMFTAYMMINGEFRKEIEINDSGGKATPIELQNGKIRFGFFHDDLPTMGVERPEGGKVYSIKFWDGAITPAKALEATAVKGTEAGTKITATPESGNSLMVLVSDTLLPFPLQGEDVPAGAQEYTSGSDLKGVDANTNKYVGVYEVDSNGKIVGFKLITLTENEILPPPSPALEITEPSGTVNVTKPAIKGKTEAGTEVTVVIKDKDGNVVPNAGGKATVDGNGDWSFTPSEDLSDGKYTIEVTAEKDSKVSKVSRDITVDTTNVVDKSALKQKAEEINGKIAASELTGSDYTSASWNNLTSALDAAESVLRDPGATQDQVNQALAALQEAEKNLVKVGGELDGLKLAGLIEDGQEKPINLTPDVDLEKYKHYQATVTDDVYAISLDPKAKHPDETQVKVYVNNTEYSADEWSNLPLNVGDNTIIVSVQDKAGKEIDKYTITIVRGNAANKLESLVPSVGSLSPAFDPNQDTYTMSVSNSVYQIQLTPKALDPNATIQIRVNDGE